MRTCTVHLPTGPLLGRVLQGTMNHHTVSVASESVSLEKMRPLSLVTLFSTWQLDNKIGRSSRNVKTREDKFTRLVLSSDSNRYMGKRWLHTSVALLSIFEAANLRACSLCSVLCVNRCPLSLARSRFSLTASHIPYTPPAARQLVNMVSWRLCCRI